MKVKWREKTRGHRKVERKGGKDKGPKERVRVDGRSNTHAKGVWDKKEKKSKKIKWAREKGGKKVSVC